MVYDKVIEGKYVNLRSVLEDDIEFTYNIRKDPQFHGMMGCAALTIEEQSCYIMQQIKKENDYYFVIENKKGKSIGLIGVYDINEKIAEEGRSVSYGSPLENIEAGLLIDFFEREILKLEWIRINIYEENKKMIHMCRRLGYEEIGKDTRGGKKSIVMQISCKLGNSRREGYLNIIRDFEGGYDG